MKTFTTLALSVVFLFFSSACDAWARRRTHRRTYDLTVEER
jgi:hypothetical protein